MALGGVQEAIMKILNSNEMIKRQWADCFLCSIGKVKKSKFICKDKN